MSYKKGDIVKCIGNLSKLRTKCTNTNCLCSIKKMSNSAKLASVETNRSICLVPIVYFVEASDQEIAQFIIGTI